MSKNKKKLMYPSKCNKCGEEPKRDKQGNYEIIKMDCPCGGRVVTDFSKPYYE